MSAPTINTNTEKTGPVPHPPKKRVVLSARPPATSWTPDKRARRVYVI